MNYYPIIRGRQYDLLALKTMAKTLSPHIIPIIEPVKDIPALVGVVKTLPTPSIRYLSFKIRKLANTGYWRNLSTLYPIRYLRQWLRRAILMCSQLIW